MKTIAFSLFLGLGAVCGCVLFHRWIMKAACKCDFCESPLSFRRLLTLHILGGWQRCSSCANLHLIVVLSLFLALTGIAGAQSSCNTQKPCEGDVHYPDARMCLDGKAVTIEQFYKECGSVQIGGTDPNWHEAGTPQQVVPATAWGALQSDGRCLPIGAWCVIPKTDDICFSSDAAVCRKQGFKRMVVDVPPEKIIYRDGESFSRLYFSCTKSGCTSYPNSYLEPEHDMPSTWECIAMESQRRVRKSVRRHAREE